MTKEELREILDKHRIWIFQEMEEYLQELNIEIKDGRKLHEYIPDMYACLVGSDESVAIGFEPITTDWPE